MKENVFTRGVKRLGEEFWICLICFMALGGILGAL